MLNDWTGESQNRIRQIFMNLRPYFDLSYYFARSITDITLNRKPYLKRLQELFETEVGELQYESPAVVLNISWFEHFMVS